VLCCVGMVIRMAGDDHPEEETTATEHNAPAPPPQGLAEWQDILQDIFFGRDAVTMKVTVTMAEHTTIRAWSRCAAWIVATSFEGGGDVIHPRMCHHDDNNNDMT
jgi:hypothetical protein